MNRELLLSRVGDHLNVIGHEREVAANTLLQCVLAKLKYDQSIRINGIGVFQLKKEPLPREERKTFVDDGPNIKRTLVYAPVKDEFSKNVDSAFVSFDLDELNINSNDYLDKIFSLNIDKPLIPVRDSSSTEFASKVLSDERQESLEEKIEKMVTDGEILTNYNIFENYLHFDDAVKTTKEIEEDDLVKEELLKSIGNDIDEEIPSRKNPFEVDPVENYSIPGLQSGQDENVIEPQEPDDEIVNEQKETETVMIKPEDFDEPQKPEDEEIVDESGEESIEVGFSSGKITEKTETGDQEIAGEGSDPESENKESLYDIRKTIISEDNAPNEDLFAKLENYLNEDAVDERETEPDSDIEVDDKEESVGGLSATREMIDKIRSADHSHRNKPFFAKPGFIIAAAIIVIAAILIFVFRIGIGPEEVSSPANEDVTGTTTDPGETAYVELTEDSLSAVNVVQENPVERAGLYMDIPNDVQIGSQIFFDGSRYTVQVSSWKNNTIAEKEVERLRSKDFDAFIFKIYLKSKQSMWHRVRIGYFNSVEEAEDFILKNKF